MLDITSLGARGSVGPDGVEAHFELLLPGLPPDHRIDVLVIHRDDRFDPDVPPATFPLEDVGGGRLAVDAQLGPRPGRYLYRYQQLGPENGGQRPVLTRWFTDPFARMTDDVGQLSAFEAPAAPAFDGQAADWVVPELDRLVVYELHVAEFNRDFAGVADRLPYLKSLGVTCLELMPVTSVKLNFDWGYGPLHYFAPSEAWGGADELKRLIDACHAAGVAVILDVVYQHVDPSFAYAQVYRDAGVASPMIGADGQFGPQIDFGQPLAQDFVQAVNRYWLDEFGVDGFRYDEVTDLYDGPTGHYATIAYDVYEHSLALPRFGAAPGRPSRVIQAAEALGRAGDVLRDTYTSAAWQDGLLDAAESLVAGGFADPGRLGVLAASGFPSAKSVHDSAGDPVDMPVAPFQYLNSHDHSHLIAFSVARDPNAYVPLADQSRWYAIQPFVVALYTAAGIPMLWQGQEVSDNWVLAADGNLRIHFRRDMHWEYFYDEVGAPLVRLHRALGTLRAGTAALRSRETSWFSAESRPADGVLAYARGSGRELAVVVLNLSDGPQAIALPAPVPGTYVEGVDAGLRRQPLQLVAAAADDPLAIEVPSHYGYVFVRGD